MLIDMNVDILLGTHRSCDVIASGGVLGGVVVAASVIEATERSWFARFKGKIQLSFRC